MTPYFVVITIALVASVVWVAWAAARLLWDLDHHRPPGRRRANPSIRVALGVILLAATGLAAFRLRAVLAPLAGERFAWLFLLYERDVLGELGVSALLALLHVGTVLLVRGIRAVLYPAASGEYPGVRPQAVTRAILALALLVLLSSFAR